MKKIKLALDLLEKEMELLGTKEMREFVGGSSYNFGYDPGTDCVFQVLSYFSNKPGSTTCYSPEYYQSMYESYTGLSGSDGADPFALSTFFADNFVSAPVNVSSLSGDVSGTNLFCTYSDGPNNGHAVCLTFVDQVHGTAIAWDPQNNTHVVLSLSDIMSVTSVY